jgi:hypothetical protein
VCRYSCHLGYGTYTEDCEEMYEDILEDAGEDENTFGDTND